MGRTFELNSKVSRDERKDSKTDKAGPDLGTRHLELSVAFVFVKLWKTLATTEQQILFHLCSDLQSKRLDKKVHVELYHWMKS